MTKDPREKKCAVNQWGKHRWAQVFKDKVSKAHYFQVLRCRYCTVFMLAQFERVILPSGKVTMTQYVEELPKALAATLKLRTVDRDYDSMKQPDNTLQLTSNV